MALHDLIPWKSERRSLQRRDESPFAPFQREMNRMFDEFFSDAPLGTWEGRATSMVMPSVDVSETDREVVVEAELPGMSEKDVHVSLVNGVLTIRGEKKSEQERKEQNYHRVERSFTVSTDVDRDRNEASVRNGVVRIKLPKSKRAATQKIAVRGGE